jgi:dTDP-4-dehydrorhamnose 3,5-epimerase
MRFRELRLQGAFLVELAPHADERGFFARTFCEEEFAAHGLPTRFPQQNLSRNARRGTVRGLHYNAAPHRESKVVRCTAGAIWDVIVDLRAGSATRFQWTAVELTAASGAALFVPEGFAHGFVSLADATDVHYLMGRPFVADAARGLRWNEPRFGIEWPLAPAVISERDRGYPDLDEARFDG